MSSPNLTAVPLRVEELRPAAAPSLLDRIVEQQAEIATRYKPVMSLEEFKEREQIITYLVDHIMFEGIDYGWVPGTRPTVAVKAGEYQAKPTLFKSGAEKACTFFGYVPQFDEVETIEEWDGKRYGEMLFYYKYRCTLLKDGKPVGQGLGSSTTWESKYRYRKGDRTCPACDKPGTIIKGKAEYGGGWLCFAKKGGCGAKFKDGDPAIEGQATDRVANPDVADVVNTVQKMGQKRSYVAATLTATGLSGRFTQDLEDMPAPQQETAQSNPPVAAVGAQPNRGQAGRPAGRATEGGITDPAATYSTELKAILAGITNMDKAMDIVTPICDRMIAKLGEEGGNEAWLRMLHKYDISQLSKANVAKLREFTAALYTFERSIPETAQPAATLEPDAKEEPVLA